MYYGQRAADYQPVMNYNHNTSLFMNLVADGLAFFSFETGRMMRLCDFPGPNHAHYIPHEYADCYDQYHKEEAMTTVVHVQYCDAGYDITSRVTHARDATEVRLWDDATCIIAVSRETSDSPWHVSASDVFPVWTSHVAHDMPTIPEALAAMFRLTLHEFTVMDCLQDALCCTLCGEFRASAIHQEIP